MIQSRAFRCWFSIYDIEEMENQRLLKWNLCSVFKYVHLLCFIISFINKSFRADLRNSFNVLRATLNIYFNMFFLDTGDHFTNDVNWCGEVCYIIIHIDIHLKAIYSSRNLKLNLKLQICYYKQVLGDCFVGSYFWIKHYLVSVLAYEYLIDHIG
jgi:hypothetical protein